MSDTHPGLDFEPEHPENDDDRPQIHAEQPALWTQAELPPTDAVIDYARAVEWLKPLTPTLLTAINPETRNLDSYWHDGPLPAAADWMERKNRAGSNIYHGLNQPRRGLRGPKAAKNDIELIRAIGGDIDAKGGRTMPAAYTAISALPVPPTQIVMSGGGYQPLWLLPEPIKATPENIARVEAWGKRIAELTKGDAVQNVDRILRVPFTTNWPDAKKRAEGRVPCPSGLVAGGSGRRYTLDELEAAMPASAPIIQVMPASAPVVPLFPNQAPPAVLATASPSTLTAAAQAGRPSSNHDNSRSGIAMRMAVKMRAEGKTDAEIWEAIANDPATASWFTEKGALNDGREVRRILEKAGAANSTPVVAPAPLVTVGAPFSQLPNVMDPGAATAHFNARLFKASDWGGKPFFGRFNPDGTVSRLKAEDIQVLLSGHFIEIPDGKGGSKHVPAATWWAQSPDKTVFDRVVFDPENKLGKPGEKILNRWAGFAIPPAKGSWRLMRRHLWKHVCRKDRKAFKYLIRWLAFCVQYPGTNPEVMVVLRSDKEGAGKSIVGKWMIAIFGGHGLSADQWKQVFGEYDDALIDVNFVLLEEPAFPGDHQAAAVLRARLTASTISLNPKGYPRYSVPHVISYMMTTNAKWAVTAGSNARRLFVQDVDESVADNAKYFDPLRAEQDSGGIAALLYDLLRVNLKDFDVRRPPKTAALRQQQLLSASSITRWAVDRASEGVIAAPVGPTGAPMSVPAGYNFGQRVAAADLFDDYRRWCAAMRDRAGTYSAFGRWLRECGFAYAPVNHGRAGYDIPDPVPFTRAVFKAAGI